MMLAGLFILCLVALAISYYFYREHSKNLTMLFIIGIIAGFLVEYWGVANHRWQYHETDLFFVLEIPIEILLAYGTGLLLAGVMVIALFKQYDESQRFTFMVRLLPILGVITLIFGVLHAFPLGISLTFLALYGLAISERPSIPISIGVLAFIGDVVLEGILTLTTNYYAWDFGVPFAFMLVGVFFGGLLTRRKCGIGDDLCFVEN